MDIQSEVMDKAHVTAFLLLFCLTANPRSGNAGALFRPMASQGGFLICVLFLVLSVGAEEIQKHSYQTNVVAREGDWRITKDGRVSNSRDWPAFEVQGVSVENNGAIVRFVDENEKLGTTVFVLNAIEWKPQGRYTWRLHDLHSTIRIKGSVYPLYDEGIRTNIIESVITTNWTAAYLGKLVSELRQASNGHGGFQFEMGRRFLEGDDVVKNRELAIHWLRSACTNGNAQASNLLLKAQALKDQ